MLERKPSSPFSVLFGVWGCKSQIRVRQEELSKWVTRGSTCDRTTDGSFALNNLLPLPACCSSTPRTTSPSGISSMMTSPLRLYTTNTYCLNAWSNVKDFSDCAPSAVCNFFSDFHTNTSVSVLPRRASGSVTMATRACLGGLHLAAILSLDFGSLAVSAPRSPHTSQTISLCVSPVLPRATCVMKQHCHVCCLIVVMGWRFCCFSLYWPNKVELFFFFHCSLFIVYKVTRLLQIRKICITRWVNYMYVWVAIIKKKKKSLWLT